jgi:DNA invertase Pin-like site-specific DNA recombinase
MTFPTTTELGLGPRPSLKRCALYLRVSGGPGQTVENQRPALVQLARARGYEIVSIFEETASAVKKRPQFERMMLAAHRGEFDALIVWALDRLGRSMTGNLQTLLDLDRLGVETVSCQESWLQMQGPVRPLLIAMFSWVAEQERSRLIERTREGLARARREGKQIGRPRVAVDLDEALRLRSRGKGVRGIARALGVGPATVHRVLQAHDATMRASCPGVSKPLPRGSGSADVISEACVAVGA